MDPPRARSGSAHDLTTSKKAKRKQPKPESTESSTTQETSSSEDVAEKSPLRRSRSHNDFSVRPKKPEAKIPPVAVYASGGGFGFRQMPPFDIDEFYKKEAALTLEERRARYKTLEPVTLDDILPWPEYTRGLQLFDKKHLKRDWQKTMQMEKEWKKESVDPMFSMMGRQAWPAGSTYSPPSVNRREVCQYFASPTGCRNGNLCPNIHDTKSNSSKSNQVKDDKDEKDDKKPSLSDAMRKQKQVQDSSSDDESSSYEEEEEVSYKVDEDINNKIALWQGDICSLEIGGIVNAANESLLGGGGIDGAIHAAAGPTLRAECALLNGAEPGETKTSLGHNIPATRIFHTVGPRVPGRSSKLPKKTLESCYITTLEECVRTKTRSVAFCAISTGIFGYPISCATHSACKTIRKWLSKKSNASKVDRVIFCVFSDSDKAEYERIMQYYFPVSDVRINAGTSHLPSVALPHLDGTAWGKTSELLTNLKKAKKLAFSDLQTFYGAITGNKDVDVSGLKSFFQDSCADAEREKFFNTTLPNMITTALNFPTYLKQEGDLVNDLDKAIAKERDEQETRRKNQEAAELKRIQKHQKKIDFQFMFTGQPSPLPTPKRPDPEPRFPDLALGGVPELVYQRDSFVLLRRTKVVGLLCQAFLCLYAPIQNFSTNKKESHPFNFLELFGASKRPKEQVTKLKCLISYFNHALESAPTGFISVRRKIISLKRLPDFEIDGLQLCSIKQESMPLSQAYQKPNVVQLYSIKQHHRPCSEALNPNGSITSLEERCFESPELFVLNLLSNQLLVGESLEIKGVLTYNKTVKNSDTLMFVDSCSPTYHAKADTPVPLDLMVSNPVPESGASIVICNAAVNPNPAFHLNPTNFLGKELSRLYTTLLPQEVDANGKTFTRIPADFTVATTDFGCSEEFGCPPLTKFLLLSLVFSQVHGKHLKLHLSGLPKDSHLESLSKLCVKEHVELQYIWKHLQTGIPPPLHKTKIDERPKAIPALNNADIDAVYAALSARFQHWKKEKKAEAEFRRQLQLERAKEIEKMKKEQKKQQREYEKAMKSKDKRGHHSSDSDN